MERVHTLIDKLNEQYRQQAGNDKLLVTVTLLLAELQQQVTEVKSAGISVTIPSSIHKAIVVEEEIIAREPEAIIIKETVPEPVAVKPVAAVKEVIEESALNDLKKAWSYNPVKDVPTLAHQKSELLELNEAMGSRQESLNDKLKTIKTEVGSSLHTAPVRDLKKAIGINDRYLFINELFRGDETMYERSIKTINGFDMLAEAEYWIQRELKVKLGWNEDTDAVQIFDQVVRRRFV
jgi:hypothetical protein